MNLPPPLLKIVESIIYDLPDDERQTFIDAVNSAADGKDLSLVHWKLWGAELQALPQLLPKYIKTLINQVIAGMELRASGKEWPEANEVAKAVYAAVEVVADAADVIYATARDEAYASAKAYAIFVAYVAAYADSPNAEAYAAAFVTDYTTLSTTSYADFSATLAVEVTDIRIRQRDTLLSIIESAPSVKDTEKGTTE